MNSARDADKQIESKQSKTPFQLRLGQDWFILPSIALGHESDRAGLCNGVSLMAKNAILVDDVDTFDRRFNIISNTPNLLDHIKLAWEKRFTLYAEMKQSSVKELKEEKDKIKLPQMKDIKESPVNSKLTQLEKDLIDIPAFYDGVEIQQNPDNYDEVLPNEPGAFLQKSNAWVTPVLLDKEQGDALVSRFTGFYSLTSLAESFQTLSHELSTDHPINYPIAFILSTRFHSITIGYRHNSPWVFINANMLPSRKVENVTVLAKEIYSAFFRRQIIFYRNSTSTKPFLTINLSKEDLNKPIAIVTQIYSGKVHAKDLLSRIERWRKNTVWRDIYNTPMKMINSLRDPSWLFLAATIGENEVVDLLLEKNAKINQAELQQGWTPLMRAAGRGHYELVQKLLDAKADPDMLNKSKNSALASACDSQFSQIVELLISRNARTTTCNKHGLTPLHISVSRQNFNIVRMLLTARCDPNVMTKSGKTPLGIAANLDHFEIAELLLSHKASTEISNAKFGPPLQLAVSCNHMRVATLLMAYGASVNFSWQHPVKYLRENLLVVAKSMGRDQQVKKLLTRRKKYMFWEKEVILKKISNLTALHYAALNNYISAARMLLQAGANPHALANGISPLDFAEALGFHEMVTVLSTTKSMPEEFPQKEFLDNVDSELRKYVSVNESKPETSHCVLSYFSANSSILFSRKKINFHDDKDIPPQQIDHQKDGNFKFH